MATIVHLPKGPPSLGQKFGEGVSSAFDQIEKQKRNEKFQTILQQYENQVAEAADRGSAELVPFPSASEFIDDAGDIIELQKIRTSVVDRHHPSETEARVTPGGELIGRRPASSTEGLTAAEFKALQTGRQAGKGGGR